MLIVERLVRELALSVNLLPLQVSLFIWYWCYSIHVQVLLLCYDSVLLLIVMLQSIIKKVQFGNYMLYVCHNHLTFYMYMYMSTYMFVATKVFVSTLPATGWVWVIIG